MVEDADDLAGLIEELDLAPAHILDPVGELGDHDRLVGNSFAANVDLCARPSDGARFFGPVVDIVASRMPRAERVTIQGADHLSHISMPDRYVELLTTFARADRAVDSGQEPPTR